MRSLLRTVVNKTPSELISLGWDKNIFLPKNTNHKRRGVKILHNQASMHPCVLSTLLSWAINLLFSCRAYFYGTYFLNGYYYFLKLYCQTVFDSKILSIKYEHRAMKTVHNQAPSSPTYCRVSWLYLLNLCRIYFYSITAFAFSAEFYCICNRVKFFIFIDVWYFAWNITHKVIHIKFLIWIYYRNIV